MERLWPYLKEAGITEAGAVSFASCLPLLPCRAAARLPENAAAVVVCGFPYYIKIEGKRNLSRYAAVPDYHRVVMAVLEPLCSQLSAEFLAEFVPFVDNSPIREVDAAARAGLGVVGKNSLLLNPRWGSWMFLGEIVTSLPLACTEGPARPCMGCGQCKRACPAGCIGEEGIDASRCLSAITQKKGELTSEEASLVQKGGLLWGCDQCQEVCPYNREAEETYLSLFREDVRPFLPKGDIGPGVKSRAYGFRGPAPLLRNAELLEKQDKPFGLFEKI